MGFVLNPSTREEIVITVQIDSTYSKDVRDRVHALPDLLGTVLTNSFWKQFFRHLDQFSFEDPDEAPLAYTRSARPGAASDEPATGSDEPATGLARPETGSDELAMGSDELATGSDELATGSDRLTAASDGPPTATTEPACASSAEPTASLAGPTTAATIQACAASEVPASDAASKRPVPDTFHDSLPKSKKQAKHRGGLSEAEMDLRVDAILVGYPKLPGIIPPRVKELIIALYAPSPPIGDINHILTAATELNASDTIPYPSVNLGDIYSSVYCGKVAVNMAECFQYVLFTAKYQATLEELYPNREDLYLKMLPVNNNLANPLVAQTYEQLCMPMELNGNQKMHMAILRKMKEGITNPSLLFGFPTKIATARSYVFASLMGNTRFQRICHQSLKYSMISSSLTHFQEYKDLFKYVINKANTDHDSNDVNIHDVDTWAAVCDRVCLNTRPIFRGMLQQNRHVRELMAEFVKNLS